MIAAAVGMDMAADETTPTAEDILDTTPATSLAMIVMIVAIVAIVAAIVVAIDTTEAVEDREMSTTVGTRAEEIGTHLERIDMAAAVEAEEEEEATIVTVVVLETRAMASPALETREVEAPTIATMIDPPGDRDWG
jgi:hypothetical protein